MNFSPGDSIITKSLPNHPTNLHRVYDIPTKLQWIGESIVPRCFIGKVPGGQIGIVVEVHPEGNLKVLFPGGLLGWINHENLEPYTP